MEKNENSKFRFVLQIAAVLLFIVIAVWVASTASKSEIVTDVVSDFGYGGLFFVAILSGFNVVIPVPLIAFFPVFLESGFSFWPAIFIITAGMTIGDSLGYVIGDVGRKAVSLSKKQVLMVERLERFRGKHRLWPYFFLFLYASFAPVPNEIVVIPMAFLGYRFIYIFPIVFAGNFIFNTLSSLGFVGLFKLI